MPRLVGKQSNNGWYAGLFLVVAIAAAGSLQYFGVINVIPGLGRDQKVRDQSQIPVINLARMPDVNLVNHLIEYGVYQ